MHKKWCLITSCVQSAEIAPGISSPEWGAFGSGHSRLPLLPSAQTTLAAFWFRYMFPLSSKATKCQEHSCEPCSVLLRVRRGQCHELQGPGSAPGAFSPLSAWGVRALSPMLFCRCDNCVTHHLCAKARPCLCPVLTPRAKDLWTFF